MKAANTEALTKLSEKIKDVRIAMLSTIENDGSLRSRPMATIEMDDSGYIYFYTNEYTGKVQEIKHDKHVNISYSDPGQNIYVSVTGMADLITEKPLLEKYWRSYYKAWFPKGLDDPNLALLKVQIKEAEYWDASSHEIVEFFEIIKALVTGKTYDHGEHGKIEVR